MREPKQMTMTIGGQPQNLVIEMLPPSKSLKLMMFMGKAIGGPIGSLMTSFKGESLSEISKLDDGDFDFEKIGASINALFNGLDDDETIGKLNLLFSCVTINGQNLELDHPVFYGDQMAIFKVAYKALEVNFSSFLGANSALGKLVAALRSAPNLGEAANSQE